LNTPHQQSHQNISINRSLLEQIFENKKCIDLDEGDKNNIEKALVFALWAHRHQERESGQPYMEHIRWATYDYITLSKKSRLEAKDIIIMILHDTIEDRPEYMRKLLEIFGCDIYTSVLELSKESSNTMIGKFGIITKAIMSGGNNIVSNPMNYIIGKMTRIMPIKSHTQCAQDIMDLYPLIHDDLRNYHFLWKIYALSEDQFERKTADRINNLGDLTHVSMRYIEKNLQSTSIYISKAKALWRDDLVILLERWIQQLKSRQEEIKKTLPPTSI
jgi:hypothetical protein